ncbi:MAG: hypothetical protein IT383_07210 [Deltaproteobacteria bacterium]|nr:hypothetical protein [Deltaproteobacteria bacterium]
MTRSLALLVALLSLFTAAAPAVAYTVKPGDLLIRPVAGASVNAMRFAAATRATPQGGMVLGVDVDWSFDGALAFTGALRPVVSPGYLDVNLGLGAKYRLVQLGAPFIPYGSAMLTSALGGPFGHGDLHWNEGLKLAGGVDYFVMRDLAVGLEMAVEGSSLLHPVLAPELSTELLAGVTFRL